MSASPASLPKVLLVEDDPVSRAFLLAAIEALPATVHAAADCAEAEQLASAFDYDLWLVDANLPDGSGPGLLARLRSRSPATPALAHTASTLRADLDALEQAGFAEVLVKPLAAAVLHGALARALGIASQGAEDTAGAGGAKLPCWDDDAALSALHGERAHVDALRHLFLSELPDQHATVVAALATGDTGRARAVLHRLRASCGFVGAARLDAAVRRLEGDPESAPALQRFGEAARDLLDAGSVEAG